MKLIESIETISVITFSNGAITSIFSFNTDKDGVEGAETKFTQKIKDYFIACGEGDVEEEELEVYLDDGNFVSECGDFDIYLTWSDKSVIKLN